MREVAATRDAPDLEVFGSPKAAIRSALAVHRAMCPAWVADALGRTIGAVRWSENALTLELPPMGFLNLRPSEKEDGCPVECSLTDAPLVACGAGAPEEIVFVVNGSRWRVRQSQTAEMLRGNRLTSLFYASDGVFVVAANAGVRLSVHCSRLRSIPGGERLLFWSPT